MSAAKDLLESPEALAGALHEAMMGKDLLELADHLCMAYAAADTGQGWLAAAELEAAAQWLLQEIESV